MKNIFKSILKLGKLAKIAVLSLALMLTGQSCEDILAEQVISDIGNDYINSPVGFEDATKAAYSYLRAYYAQELGMTMMQMGTDTYTQGA
ncbi:MAG: hypothetical protein ACI9K1_001249, partial [Arcticibacterium sp.]